jgi:hypothetical protein
MIRALAIMFGTIGGLAPIVTGLRISVISGDTASVVSQIGYLFIGAAASLLAFDRYFGISTGWLRYVAALSALQRLRAGFLFEWSELALKAANPPTQQDLEHFLQSARFFRLAVIDIIERETEVWNTEFSSSFAALEKTVRGGREDSQASDGRVHSKGNLNPRTGELTGSRKQNNHQRTETQKPSGEQNPLANSKRTQSRGPQR